MFAMNAKRVENICTILLVIIALFLDYLLLSYGGMMPTAKEVIRIPFAYPIIVSIIIEGFIFSWFFKNISYTKAFGMACVGKAACWIISFPLLWAAFLLSANVSHIKVIVLLLTILVFSFLESGIIAISFNYRIKQLLTAVLISNLITALLIGLFFWFEVPLFAWM
jgi:hypothetical protein